MKKKNYLSVGDKVIYRGGWGQEEPTEAVVEEIEIVKPSEKYGRNVQSMQLKNVATKSVVVLDDGHWAYGYQIVSVK